MVVQDNHNRPQNQNTKEEEREEILESDVHNKL